MTASTLTYTAQPASNGGFTLSNESGFSAFCKTLKLAKSYAEFAGAALIVLKKDGTAKN